MTEKGIMAFHKQLEMEKFKLSCANKHKAKEIEELQSTIQDQNF